MKILLLLTMLLPAAAQANEYTVTHIDVYDGDTINGSIEVFPNISYVGAIRIRGIDTPEIRTRSACEKTLGLKARGALRQMLSGAGHVTISNVSNGKYAGRVIADVEVDGYSVGGYMLQHGYARQYSGGKRNRHWCGP